jgi:trk system potassium uptake protein TrkH
MNKRVAFALGFVVLIVIGAILLSSPIARVQGHWGGFSNAAFIATSAVCVTGLSVVDIAKEYTFVGQIVLLVLVELGCLGLMTCGTFLLVAIGRRLSLSREFSLMNAYGVAEVQGLKGLVVWTICSTLIIEGISAALLYLRFGNVYESIFYSVMSFCNAGFSLYPDSISRFASDYKVILIMGVETILGGIGFLVIYNICTFRFLRKKTTNVKGRLSLHTKIVLRFTLYLLAFMMAVFLLLEWSNSLSVYTTSLQKAVVAFYHAVTPRTCGFSIVSTEDLQPLTRLVYEILMFIGGAPGSAAAGIKITTFAILVYTLVAMCRGDNETIVSFRTIPSAVVRESIVIVTALLMFIVIVDGSLLLTEANGSISHEALFFEAVSAVTTTGLSMGDTTAMLSLNGRIVVMVAMFIGRLGALTVVMMIGDREVKRHINYPSEEVVVG